MRLSILAAGVAILMLAAGAPLRADEDCDNVVKSLDEAIAIATKNFDVTMDDLKKSMSAPADDKKKAAVKNTFCSASGELMGASRASRAIAGECRPSERAALARLDRSIKEMENAIEKTCN